MGLAPYGEPRFAGRLRSILETDDRGAVRLLAPVRFVAPRAGRRHRRGRGRARHAAAPRRRSARPGARRRRRLAAAGLRGRSLQAGRARARAHRRARAALHRRLRAELRGGRQAALGRPLRRRAQLAGGRRHGLGARRRAPPPAGVWACSTAAASTSRGYYLGSEPGEPPAVALPFEERVTGDFFDHLARELAAGRIVAWCRDRMELGARALGARSILADARVSPACSRGSTRRSSSGRASALLRPSSSRRG